ncbi:hypothetical protein DESUT3_06450 [Desulfuromonas versatilis]|uniref:Na+/H+ antiporter MnhB subunit-related protein domain-containing protein n=1 Tax=Desulfuromonas versatilis TaxID=2802975 RepID=A0ABN6DUA8_9BACT|nr:MnhB domain-containing protein [Desulfuromonas versatilis]BCR03576.1 hypothetical protein DESUT3_06450 [Desulfuromonas versatilis]
MGWASDDFGGRIVLPLLVAAVGLAVGWAVWELPAQSAGLRELVLAHLEQSGVKSPVTAVLLNFRGYDTLLEVAVLLLAVLGSWALGRETLGLDHHSAGPVLRALLHELLPVMVLVAGYLLWLGGHAPGGAFQAAAVLAAGGILLVLAGRQIPGPLIGWPWCGLLCLGFLVFMAVALGSMASGGHFLQYPAGWAKPLILLIEATLTLSIAAILLALFSGGRPAAEAPEQSENSSSREDR